MRRIHGWFCGQLVSALNRWITDRALTVIDPDGVQYHCGTGKCGAAPVVHIKTADLLLRLFLNPDLAAGEGYMDGTLTIERGTLREVMELFFGAIGRGHTTPLDGAVDAARYFARPFHQANRPSAARFNAGHHYDLNPGLYRDMLGSTLEYSCAYFDEHDLAAAADGLVGCLPSIGLDTAQRQKEEHIALKLRLAPGMQVLDIGCGWGSLALYLARTFNVKILGITLSREQLVVCNRRACEAGLEGQVRFELCDYRAIKSRYDRIVSVGMFEHVGAPNFGTFFDALNAALEPSGVALIHTTGRIGGPGTTHPFIRKYIFPGGYIPALSEIVTASQRTDLMVTDVEVLRLHYALTLRLWERNFAAVRERARTEMGERFVRMWEFYLLASEMSFIHGNFVNFQLQFSKDRSVLPLTRDYMAASRDIGSLPARTP